MTVPWMAAKIVLRPVGELRAHAGNARLHSADQIEQIRASMLAFGFTNPLLVDEDDVLIAGHGRLDAAQGLGIARVPVIALKHLSSAQKDALRLADNRIAENATWDQALLRDALAAVQAGGDVDLLLTGFGADDIAGILAAAQAAVDEADEDAATGAPGAATNGEAAAPGETEGVTEDPADAAPVAPRVPVARAGAIWRLGEHRLACGDSSNRSTVARVLRSDRAALLFTSPPYGNQRDYTTGGVSDWDALMQGVFAHLDQALARDAQVLVNLGLIHREGEWQPYWQGWLDWMRAQGWRRFGWYVWDQGPGLPGDWNGRLAPSHEFIFHFNRAPRKPNKTVESKHAGETLGGGGLRGADGTVHRKTGFGNAIQSHRIPDSVFRIMRHKGGLGAAGSHPAVFPVALVEAVLEAFTDPGDLVFEPFCGSGTQLIAAERTGRRCCAVELDPVYCDVAVQRWEMATGRKATPVPR